MSTKSSQTVIRADIYFPEKDKALRDDVRRLGQLVGELVREQGGEALFDLVEAARLASIAHREGDAKAVDELRALLAELTPKTANDFIRAFSTYFQMVNMAEKVHRLRRRRAYQQDTATPQPRGFIDTLRKLREHGVDLEIIEEAFHEISVEPVFTAHLTEVTRRTLLRKQQSIARHLVEMLDPYMTGPEQSATLGRIRLEMTTGWQTEDHSEERRLSDDAEHVLFFLTDVLYRMIPPFYEGIEDALAVVYGDEARRIRLPVLVHFGSWVGGDMDGNPSVTAKSIRETMARHRALVLDRYYNECRELGRHLSQGETRTGFAPEIRARCEHYAGHFPKAMNSVPARHRGMPYRVFLSLIAARLQATFDDDAYPYESADELIEDIELIADSLRANRGQHAGLFAVNRLLRRIRTFGFHMATLDIRQRADVHHRVVGEGLGEAAWDEFTSAQAIARLKRALDRRESPAGALSSEARRTLGAFQTIAHCRRKYGMASMGPYIVSMAHGPEDVLSVLLLARWGHLGPKNSDVPLDIAPLFETVTDLENVDEIMTRLLGDERYRRHLEARGDHQVVMIGYGDSHQDGGVISACWTMHKAQQALFATCSGFGVRLTVFHGHGGTIGRAGRRRYEAVLATPRGPGSDRLRMTEQGERINARYGLRGIAMRTLEQATSALLAAATEPAGDAADEARWHPIMDAVADESRRAYRALVDEAGGFDDYFRAATPVDVIEKLGLGVHRLGDVAEEAFDIGASQWEFAWAQNRCLMPAWYGFASGVRHGMEQFGEETIRELFQNWLFARVLLSDVELSLAKADLDIAERYSTLAGALHDTYYGRIRAEYERSVETVLALTDQSRLLEASTTLRRAIRLRNPYVDPMSYLQVDLLERWRASGRQDDDVLKALRASINGIAHGMQNTG